MRGPCRQVQFVLRRQGRDNIVSVLQQSSPGCLLHDRIPDPSYRISSRWLSTRSGSCWRPYHARHHRWTFCLSLYWRTARKSLHRPSRRPENSQHASSQRRCCRYWRRRGSTGRCQSTTGRYLTYWQSLRCSKAVLARLRRHLSQLQELQQAAVCLQAKTFDRDGTARCPWQRSHCGWE